MDTNELIPPIINGIETAKNSTKQRREIVKQTYIDLLEKLQQTKDKKAVHNDFLGVDVYIIMRESYKKASLNAAASWQATYAVKKLETIIKNAKQLSGETIYKEAKTQGKQKEFGYVNMAILYYTFESEKHWYMNFTAKLTIGIKSNGRHVQYCIDKVEIE
ncbi:hypothetical protein FACS189440_10380 [Bacteroidia bacterium]|nr:hypothetical protein FACS189440_10380 [Bacteroidia bacterium]